MGDWALVSVTGAATLLLTAIFRRLALVHALLDIPNQRSSHENPVPRGGGVAIVIAYLFALVLLRVTGQIGVPAFVSLTVGGSVVASVGLLDDFREVGVATRIMVHVAAASWAVFWLGGLPTITAGVAEVSIGIAGYGVSVLLLVWLLNLYNFMDGIDGIAAAETLFVAGSAALLLSASGRADLALGLACLASAAVAFLYWNWPPARIFMGDVGSGFLGYTLGVLALVTASAGALSIWTWLILLGVFLADASVTLFTRFIRGEPWYMAHRSHAYQRASRRWGSHKKVTLAVLGLNLAWLLPLAALSEAMPQSAWWLTIVAFIPLVAIAVTMGAGHSGDEGDSAPILR